MSEELDRRAALAMGWVETNMPPCWNDKAGGVHWVGGIEGWSPSTDRNDLAELLREVERQELSHELSMKLDWLWSENEAKYVMWLLTADPAIVCEAACEVLEEK